MLEALLLLGLLAGGESPPGVADTIRRELEFAGEPASLRYGDESIHAKVALPRFYERRGFEPAWSSADGVVPGARALVDAIAGAGAEGLRPPDYHLETLSVRLAEPQRGPRRDAELDILLTDAFLTFAAHLVGGRVDPATFDPEWVAVRREVDLVALLESVAAGQPVVRALAGLRPEQPGYKRLVSALATYRRIAENGGWPQVPPGPALKPGMRDSGVPALRRRLAAEGYPVAAGGTEHDLYDDELAAAVVAFQQRHGLDDDGIVGTRSREALNVTAAGRARQIELNLERWRWLPRDLGERHVRVNLPAYRVDVMESGRNVLSMKAIVGRAARRTPVFSDTIRYLVFSPSWEVPPTILRQDKLPEIRRNPGYLAEQNMRAFRLVDGSWVEVDGTTVDWTAARVGNVRLRQRPGPNNALGGVKFMFPNAFNIYLHDTPARELFDRSQRDFSSGCVRLEKPADLALYLLRGDEAWDESTVREAMASGVERTVRLSSPVPVHILHWSAWVGDDGTVEFRQDLYGRDRRLDAALRLPPPDGGEGVSPP